MLASLLQRGEPGAYIQNWLIELFQKINFYNKNPVASFGHGAITPITPLEMVTTFSAHKYDLQSLYKYS